MTKNQPRTRTHLESATRGGRYYHLEARWTPNGRFTRPDGRRYDLVKVVDTDRVLGATA